MWIMLTSKLPTEVSPPKMSIFWSTPWPDDHYAKEQMTMIEEKKSRRSINGYEYEYYEDVIGVDEPTTASFYSLFGREPNWIGARKIHFADHDIRVFPNEFSKVKPENMHLYVYGDHNSRPSHKLVTETVAEDRLMKGVLEGDDKFVYDAALVDGCTPVQAMSTALGMDITIPEGEFIPLGWYRPEPWTLDLFCEDWEKTEKRSSEPIEKIAMKPKKKSSRKRNEFSLLGGL